ncbi:chemotaxis protein CheW [Aquimonas voraii]|uniref:Purine-binding chemotaxis protein CheW n=1 Tax=Aquimonas voraii TaxID=265719 RepID=A0A1G6ZIK0_9GAMM|nr:chemotaxis protein CheW [Aquimonas voraii]SDE02137.1 purine-binding chemotaxis protein CheW [Aquimonas voraii]
MDSAHALQTLAEPARQNGDMHDHQCLSFVSGGTHFGVDIAAVKEILQYAGVTEVPMTPPCIRGVINLRGLVVPVVDLAIRLERQPSPPGRRACVIIVELTDGAERHDIGVLVDGVSEVVDVAASEVMPVPNFGTAVRADFIRGMVNRGESFLILLDITSTFDFQELAGVRLAALDHH